MSGLWKFYKVRDVAWEAKSIHYTANEYSKEHFRFKYQQKYPEAEVGLYEKLMEDRNFFYITIKFTCVEDEAAFIMKECK